MHQGILGNDIHIAPRNRGASSSVSADVLDQAVFELGKGARVFAQPSVKDGSFKLDVHVGLRKNGPGVHFQLADASLGPSRLTMQAVGPNCRALYGGGKDILDALQARLWADGVAYSTVRHLWFSGHSDNFTAYSRNRTLRMSPELAAANTWSGRYWSEAGFKKVSIVDRDESVPSFSYVLVDRKRE